MLPSLDTFYASDFDRPDTGTGYVGGTTVKDAVRLLALIIDGEVRNVSLHTDAIPSCCFYLRSDYGSVG